MNLQTKPVPRLSQPEDSKRPMQASMSPASRTGEVGCSSTMAPASWTDRTCWRALTVVAVSVASSGGRRMTRAPQRSATAAISGSSVETAKPPRRFEASAASMDQAISGLPAISLTFLRGMPFEPPRAGMTAK
jgi:hypothetical protein